MSVSLAPALPSASSTLAQHCRASSVKSSGGVPSSRSPGVPETKICVPPPDTATASAYLAMWAATPVRIGVMVVISRLLGGVRLFRLVMAADQRGLLRCGSFFGVVVPGERTVSGIEQEDCE